MTRRFVLLLLARLDASPLPRTDPVWLELEWELLGLLLATAPTVRAIPAAPQLSFSYEENDCS